MSRGFSKHNDAFRAAILAALDQGPACIPDIEARMGVKPAQTTHYFLVCMERRGIVERDGVALTEGKRRPAIRWRRVQQQSEAA